jgi:hypothetical protein
LILNFSKEDKKSTEGGTINEKKPFGFANCSDLEIKAENKSVFSSE